MPRSDTNANQASVAVANPTEVAKVGFWLDTESLDLATFAELVNVGVAPAGLYLDQKEVEPILKAGLNSAKEKTRAFAQAAQESLLNAGLFEYLAVGG